MYWQRGSVTEEQALLLFKHLPVDISYADENDVLLFWSGKDAYKTCDARYIGRDVRDCHPEPSLPVLEEILRAFKAGERDVAEGWESDEEGLRSRTRYVAVRDRHGAYKGILEIIQDLRDVRGLTGDQKLPGW